VHTYNATLYLIDIYYNTVTVMEGDVLVDSEMSMVILSISRFNISVYQTRSFEDVQLVILRAKTKLTGAACRLGPTPPQEAGPR
jgi:hypothetical protein